MKGKTVLVTGATDGIGRETARVLAGKGARILIAGRNPERCLETVEAINRDTPGADAMSFVADLSSLKAIERLAEEVRKFAGKIDVLVNNAGAMFTKRQVSADGIEMTLALNHVGYFALTHRLLELLKANAPARIVCVASGAHQGATLNFDNLEMTRGYSGWRQYQNSKLANIYFTRSLAKRLEGTGVTVNCLHPGFVASSFGNNNTGLFKTMFSVAKNIGAIPVPEGAKTSVYLASSPEVEGVSGQYFDKCKAVSPSQAAQDDAAAERLWAWSVSKTGLGA